MNTEIIVITKVSEWIDYEFQGEGYGGACHSMHFNRTPKVGETWRLFLTGALVNGTEFVS